MYGSVMFLPFLAGQWNTDNTTDTLPVERTDKKNWKPVKQIFATLYFFIFASYLSTFYNPPYDKHIFLLNIYKLLYL